jgi:hypothetical protein
VIAGSKADHSRILSVPALHLPARASQQASPHMAQLLVLLFLLLTILVSPSPSKKPRLDIRFFLQRQKTPKKIVSSIPFLAFYASVLIFTKRGKYRLSVVNLNPGFQPLSQQNIVYSIR